ncbi:MAG: ribonuclease H-like domain-containing protein [Treponema sp.]|nr:ribonuclease H-like domain-containing protein [Treponema sp.]
MANLRDRLKRIQELKQTETARQAVALPAQTECDSSDGVNELKNRGWDACGFKTMKRKVNVPSPFKSIKSLPAALAVLVPDLAGRDIPLPGDFLFFDLETTGLSGGAGTAAFLAAFGKLKTGKLQITQYLLLDYPGENDFLEAVLQEFKNEQSVIVTYNGKCFDSQILRTRCLMNAIKPPFYFHADLLHPARRLWKNIILGCSQASIEAKILGIDRGDDIPGALAPEIWFEFLKTGRIERLTGICDHNCADIAGLASILAEIARIASDPAAAGNYDIERLSLYWRGFIRRRERNSRSGEKSPDGGSFAGLRLTGEKLLRLAADKNSGCAAYVYSYDLMRKGNYSEAFKYIDRGLKLFEEGTVLHDKLLRRKERLIKKINLK